jgi:hypothetical protein
MKKVIIIIALNLAIWFGLTGLYNTANASEYNKAVIGHVITETIKGTDIDHTALLESEMQKIVYALAVEITLVMQEHLPFILESVAKEIRDNSDLAFKCELLKDSKIKDKDCK